MENFHHGSNKNKQNVSKDVPHGPYLRIQLLYKPILFILNQIPQYSRRDETTEKKICILWNISI